MVMIYSYTLPSSKHYFISIELCKLLHYSSVHMGLSLSDGCKYCQFPNCSSRWRYCAATTSEQSSKFFTRSHQLSCMKEPFTITTCWSATLKHIFTRKSWVTKFKIYHVMCQCLSKTIVKHNGPFTSEFLQVCKPPVHKPTRRPFHRVERKWVGLDLFYVLSFRGNIF